MAPPPCSAKEAGSEEVSGTPRSQSREVPGRDGARTSLQSPTSRPVSSLSRGEARPAVLHQDSPKLPSGPAWVPLTPTQTAGAPDGGAACTQAIH